MNNPSDKKCDLHVHSDFSDSDMSVEDIFRRAKVKGLSCLAITDHDTVAGLDLAMDFSRKYEIELVNGLEVSAQKDNIEVHVLGYFVDPHSGVLTTALQQVRQLRHERIEQMIAKLNALGFAVKKEEVLAKVKDGVPTRLHLALVLLEKRIVNSLVDAFKKYLSPGKPAYVARFKHNVREAIKLIKDSGGLSFAAHPFLLPSESWIEEFASYGLDGIEVSYPRLSDAKKAHYRDIAQQFGLLKSGGSDAHGSYKKYTDIGDVTIPYAWVEQMKEKLKNPRP